MTVINYPGPYDVRIFYTVSGLTHNMRFNCNVVGTPAPGTLFNAIEILRADGTTNDLEDELTQLLAVIKPFFAAATTDFVRAELWKYEPESFAADFVTVFAIAQPGTSASAAQLAGQWIFTFRTLEGGVMKVSLMESTGVPGVSATPPYTSLSLALSNYIKDENAAWLGRDSSYPFADIANHPGQNEAIFKRRYRTL